MAFRKGGKYYETRDKYNWAREKKHSTSQYTEQHKNHKPGINYEIFDSLTELKNVIAYYKRYLNYKKMENINKAFSTEELDKALVICIQKAQLENFEEDIEIIKKQNTVKQRSHLKS